MVLLLCVCLPQHSLLCIWIGYNNTVLSVRHIMLSKNCFCSLAKQYIGIFLKIVIYLFFLHFIHFVNDVPIFTKENWSEPHDIYHVRMQMNLCMLAVFLFPLIVCLPIFFTVPSVSAVYVLRAPSSGIACV